MKIFIPVLFLLVLPTTLLSQKEANYWYFGNKAGLNFGSGQPVSDTNGIIGTAFGSSTVSDSLGNLLFYANSGDFTIQNNNFLGVVCNKYHQVMPNGYLGDTCSSSMAYQNTLILPKVGSTDQYYLFTLDDVYRGSNIGLKYSIIDMKLDSGKGDVLKKGILINDSLYSGMAATKHSNGIDYWLIVRKNPEYFGPKWQFYAYQITANGIKSPVVSNQDSKDQMQVTCKFSPDGNLLYSGEGIYEFDKSSGKLGNFSSLGWYGSYNCAEFSVDNKVLYSYYMSSTAFYIYQFDLTAKDISSTRTVIDSLQGGGIKGNLQLGPDNKIYVSHVSYPFVSVIEKPEVLGNGCNFNKYKLSLSGREGWWEFPNFPSSYFNNSITSISEQIDPVINIAVYPNPAKGSIQFKGLEKKEKYLIFNIHGKPIIEGEIDDEKKINIESLSTGIYIVKLGNGYQGKFIVR